MAAKRYGTFLCDLTCDDVCKATGISNSLGARDVMFADKFSSLSFVNMDAKMHPMGKCASRQI